MRAAPACQVSLRRFGVWQGAVLTLAALGFATLAAWLLMLPRPATAQMMTVASLASVALAALGVSLATTPPIDLRWDGRAWHLGPAANDPVAGEVTIAIDLGPWMLLRFIPALPESSRRTVWLPVQRRGLESHWHALRCAVYSPRPLLADDPNSAL